MHVEGTMTDSDATVRPAFANAHTHIGDSVAKEAGAGLSLDDLVAPPDGLGTSGARDDDFAERRRATREAGKSFGSHAGERDPHDHTPALGLDPTVLVHAVHPEPERLDRIERDAVPVVVCPRSNLVTGVGTPPIADLLERTTVALDTGNVMLDSPSMSREMESVAKVGGRRRRRAGAPPGRGVGSVARRRAETGRRTA